MSFILDALKKSESDRQRQHGPALFEVRVAPPRTRLPPWAIAIALLLAVNLGVVMWMLLRHQVHARAPAAQGSAFGGHVRRGTAAGVPLYQDAAATGGAQFPQLRLDLHVYASRPQDRFVMINMHKLREGDSLPEGVHVESITPEGAVLSYNGSRFLLPRD